MESPTLRKKSLHFCVYVYFCKVFFDKTILYCVSLCLRGLGLGGGRGRGLSPDGPVRRQLLFGKTGLFREGVVGENRVVPRGAGGVGVGAGGGVLLERHRQVQVLICGGHR